MLGDTNDYSPTGAWLGYHTVLWENGSITDLPSLYTSSRGEHRMSPSPYGHPLLDSGQALLMGWKFNQSSSGPLRTFVWSEGALSDIGDDIPVASNQSVLPVAMNSTGQVLALPTKGSARDSYLWQNHLATQIGPFSVSPAGLSSTAAAALNSKGNVVGAFDFYDSTGVFKGSHGFSWQNGSFTDLGSLSNDATGSGYGNVKVINDAGQFAGTVTKYNPLGTRLGDIAVLWNQGTRTEIGTPALDRSYVPLAINNRGQLLGSINYGPPDDITSYRTFLYSNGVLTTLAIPNLPNVSAQPLALNDAGQIIGNYTSSRGEAGFFWQNGVVSQLSFGNRSDGYGYTHIFLLTDDGNVYGTHMNFNGNVNTGFSAFRWNPTDGLTELNPLIADFAALGWSSLEHIYDINDAGQLVGTLVRWI